MISGLCKEGMFDEALAMKSKMEENGCIPDAVTFEIIIRSLFVKDQNDKAEKLLHEMIAKGLLPFRDFHGERSPVTNKVIVNFHGE